MKLQYLSLLFILSSVIWSPTLLAEGIGLNKSRIIFSAKDKSQTIELNNENNLPYLVQASILHTLDKEKISDKFIITPPLFRVDAQKKYSVRILPNDISELPKDKESIFYFKIRAIPPTKPSEENTEKADLVFITAIIVKMYYRPDNIPTLDHSTFEKIKIIKDKNNWRINNPTPYFITIVDLSINNKTQQGSLLISPFSSLEMEKEITQISQASWRFIDDFGGISKKYLFQEIETKKNNDESVVKN